MMGEGAKQRPAGGAAGAGDDVVLEVRGLTAGYGGVPAIRDVDLSLRRGEIMAIVGKSGCGKTTLLKSAIGLLSPSRGSVRLFGVDPYELDAQGRTGLLKRIGMLFQQGALFGSMTVGDNVALPLRELTDLPEEVIRRVVEAKLSHVGLAEMIDRPPSSLSGGQQKRAAIARAMALDPEILFSDEPTAGLDPVVAASIDATLLRLRRVSGSTLVLVTHDTASVRTVADRVMMMHEGRVVATGTPAELAACSDPVVVDFFNRALPADRADLTRSLFDALTEGAPAEERP